MTYTKEQIDLIKFNLLKAEEEKHNIEVFNKKETRPRWRELKKIIEHYKYILNRYGTN